MEKYIEKIKTAKLNRDECFEFSKCVSIFLNSDNADDNQKARDAIIYALENWDNIFYKEIWQDLVEAAGFFPYFQRKEMNGWEERQNAASLIREAHHKSDYTPKILHAKQKELSNLIMSGKNVIVSAPTSFGKSLLIEEIVASKKYKNIVIIQPTLALLDETRIKLKRYNTDYKIIVRTSQPPDESRGNIFLLTAERVIEYAEMPKIDLMVLDEFYKLSSKRDDKRSSILNNAFLKLVSGQGSKFYMLGPNIDEIPQGFVEKYDAIFFKTDYSLVVNEEIYKYDEVNSTRGVIDEQDLYSVLDGMNEEQTLVFCSSPGKARKLAFGYHNHLKAIGKIKERELPLVQWIEENITANWSLKKCLSAGIAVHDGTLQKHITTSIIQYFNDEKLDFIFCTTTIIEGVNTSAKNVVFYDDKIYNKQLDYFDYSNIKGRAGRLMKHYTGKIINLKKPPERERMVIDFPFFDQEFIEDEVLVNLEKKEIKDIKDNKQRYEDFYKLDKDLQDLLKSNGVSIKSQIEILNILEMDLDDPVLRETITWTRFPTAKELHRNLLYLFELCWDRLASKDETNALPQKKPQRSKWLVSKTVGYCISNNLDTMIRDEYSYRYKQAMEKKALTQEEIQEIIDDAVERIFRVYRSWFQYKIPKWLRVMNSLQEYACHKKGIKAGSYKFLAEQIENDFTTDKLRILLEYGIPSSAVQKLNNMNIPDNLSEEQIINGIKKNINHTALTSRLTKYELDTIKRSL